MAGGIAPSDITLAFTPRRRADLTAVELDGETVVYEPQDGAMRKLDVMGTALWNCFDGRTSLVEIVEDLTAVYGADADDFEADVLRYVQDLGRAGMLAGVRSGSDGPDPAR